MQQRDLKTSLFYASADFQRFTNRLLLFFLNSVISSAIVNGALEENKNNKAIIVGKSSREQE